FGFQVSSRPLAERRCAQRLDHDFDTGRADSLDLFRVVGEQPDPGEPEPAHTVRGVRIAARIFGKAEAAVRGEGIGAGAFGHPVALRLRDEPEATPLLFEIDEYTVAGFLDEVEGEAELGSAIAVLGVQRFTVEAAGVNPHEATVGGPAEHQYMTELGLAVDHG